MSEPIVIYEMETGEPLTLHAPSEVRRLLGGGEYQRKPIADAVSPSKPETADDLTKIKGIGQKRAAELEELGIRTYAQLANEELAYLVVVTEVSPTVLQEWINQAQDLITSG